MLYLLLFVAAPCLTPAQFALTLAAVGFDLSCFQCSDPNGGSTRLHHGFAPCRWTRWSARCRHSCLDVERTHDNANMEES
eukprot:669411-Amphidinium_carterae.1